LPADEDRIGIIDEEMRKTHVSFRVYVPPFPQDRHRCILLLRPSNIADRPSSLPPHAHPSTVRVLGSWDNFTTPLLLEQDRRVGRDVWKGLFTVNGGLEMGSEHLYYVGAVLLGKNSN
jgi:hypothetical protein